MLECAFCDQYLESLQLYKIHLKVLHNKCLYGEKLRCGQQGCPLVFSRFQTLCNHIAKKHPSQCELPKIDETVGTSSCDKNAYTHFDHSPDSPNKTDEHDVQVNEDKLYDNLVKRIDQDGIYKDAGYFIARLRCHPTMSLATSVEVMELCSDLVADIMMGVEEEVLAILQAGGIENQRSQNLAKVMAFFKQPFQGLETVYKQNKYFESRQFYNPPKSIVVGQAMEIGKVPVPGKQTYQTKLVTVEYISQSQLFQSFLAMPGVLDSVRNYLTAERDGSVICDFIDGDLWANHPVRLLHHNSPNTVVIPVFDYFDDFEPANPIGSHASKHKVGAKYTVIKGIDPMFTSKLENIQLNMLICSQDRSLYSNKEVFDVYLDEMTKLETEGFELSSNGQIYRIFVTVVQVIGDNLGLNSVLGYIESFTGNYPCRLCKIKRDQFNKCFVEDTSYLRSQNSYDNDVDYNDPSKSGVKEQCCYNKIPSFHVTNNVFCDLMHDLLEGICRYVMQSLLCHLVLKKKYFSITQLNSRMKTFIYDHSSEPPCISADQLKKDCLIFGAIQMLNFVLGFSVMVGDLVPEGDEAWEVYLLMRKVLLLSCSIRFDICQLDYMRIVIAEFLQAYSMTFKKNLTLKFHNLCHYPRIMKMLGPMFLTWVMRCEGKHWEMKKVAASTGSFKNVCKTLAIRNQMKTAERLMAGRGLTSEISCMRKCVTMTLGQLVDGERLSSMLGGYGLYRDIYQVDKVTARNSTYNKGDVMILNSCDLFPEFALIKHIFLSDTQDCYFVCGQLETVAESHHHQAYEVEETEQLCVITAEQVQTLPSPWPLKIRLKDCKNYVALKHSI